MERTEGTCQPGSVCGAARLPDSPFPRRSSASDARLGQAGPGRPAPDRRHPCREGARLFVPCPGAARQRRSLHIEDGLWDGDGTSRFPPCLGAHRFEELFCFLDFFSPCSPRPESSPSPRPRGHRLLTPSAESVRRVRSLPRPRTPHGGSRGEAEPPQRGDDARDGAARPQTITSLLPPSRPLRTRVCTGTCPKGRLRSLSSWLCTPEPEPREILLCRELGKKKKKKKN